MHYKRDPWPEPDPWNPTSAQSFTIQSRALEPTAATHFDDAKGVVIIDLNALHGLIKSADESQPVHIIDARLPEEFQEAHLEVKSDHVTVANNCVLEMGFPQRLSEAVIDKNARLVFYGQQ